LDPKLKHRSVSSLTCHDFSLSLSLLLYFLSLSLFEATHLRPEVRTGMYGDILPFQWVWNGVHSALWVQLKSYLERNSSGFGLENRKYGRRDPSCWPRGTIYPKKLELTSPTSCGRSVGRAHSWTQATELFSLFFSNSHLHGAVLNQAQRRFLPLSYLEKCSFWVTNHKASGTQDGSYPVLWECGRTRMGENCEKAKEDTKKTTEWQKNFLQTF
jgi:hypothetical protein